MPSQSLRVDTLAGVTGTVAPSGSGPEKSPICTEERKPAVLSARARRRLRRVLGMEVIA